ncbi:MAG: FHA domain-containing protein, partial [Eubacteriales bacterium]|nr:FHA domain-containing protein [Eubacteriales bacterium]
GSESAGEIVQCIESLERNASQTRFFDAVNKALELTNTEIKTLPERKVIVAVTDGQDVYDGGNTRSEALDKLQEANLPFYALGIKDTDEEYIDSLGEFARSSNGIIELLDTSNVADTFSKINEYINHCYVMTLSAKTNIIDGSTKQLNLQIQLDDNTLIKTTSSVTPELSEEDTTVPKVVSVEATAEKEISVYFSEDVTGADDASNFQIMSDSGVKSNIAQIYYSDVDYKTTIILGEPVYNGDYTLELLNISDFSMQENALEKDKLSFSVEDNEPPEEEVSFIAQYWWGIIIVIVIAAALIVLIVLSGKKKKQTAAPETVLPDENADIGLKHHVKSMDGKKIKLNINDANGLERVLDVFVKNRVTLGRSDVCDIYFDDLELSRRHACIVFRDGELFIEDLNSTNGTIVNGIKIGAGRRLDEGDIIEIGQVKIIISM